MASGAAVKTAAEGTAYGKKRFLQNCQLVSGVG